MGRYTRNVLRWNKNDMKSKRMIKGDYCYRASTRLRYQSFDNRLEDEPQVVTPIPQSLMDSLETASYRDDINALLAILAVKSF